MKITFITFTRLVLFQEGTPTSARILTLFWGMLFAPCTTSCTHIQFQTQGHAHNDYAHQRPLFDALEHGFCSIEADVWWMNHQLLVAHHSEELKPGRTLQALYLEPLGALAEQHHGRLCKKTSTLIFLIDIKSEPLPTYLALKESLKPYSKWLTHFYPNRTDSRAITVIITGHRPTEWMAKEQTRLAAYDGRISDLNSNVSPHLIPLVSDKWSCYFGWQGKPNEGPVPAHERQTLRFLVQTAHRQGRLLRFWGTPDTRAAWQELYRAGVDYISTDDLDGVQNFLSEVNSQ